MRLARCIIEIDTVNPPLVDIANPPLIILMRIDTVNPPLVDIANPPSIILMTIDTVNPPLVDIANPPFGLWHEVPRPREFFCIHSWRCAALHVRHSARRLDLQQDQNIMTVRVTDARRYE